MVDLEGLYDFNDAARLGKEMEQGLFFWFEAPINDELLEQYSELRNFALVADYSCWLQYLFNGLYWAGH